MTKRLEFWKVFGMTAAGSGSRPREADCARKLLLAELCNFIIIDPESRFKRFVCVWLIVLKACGKDKAVVSQQLDGTLCYSIIAVARLKTAWPSMSLRSLFASSLMDQRCSFAHLGGFALLGLHGLTLLAVLPVRTVTDCMPPRHLSHRHP